MGRGSCHWDLSQLHRLFIFWITRLSDGVGLSSSSERAVSALVSLSRAVAGRGGSVNSRVGAFYRVPSPQQFARLRLMARTAKQARCPAGARMTAVSFIRKLLTAVAVPATAVSFSVLLMAAPLAPQSVFV